ncbi:TadE/TadG family type IV pilus assembly protein [Frigidibacter sp. MR17.14]|uniref:TadE/TadG family type IV pilus assembly protein n=1 Tax=Frigidibacter sp. MR17.14 TaxID=3126509 RepID=UPI003012AB35
MTHSRIPSPTRFRRADEGVALVEFALLLPMLLLLFAVTIEAARMVRSYQAVSSGVRDAARYLARVAPADICDTGGSLAGYEDALTEIVSRSYDSDDDGQTSSVVTAGVTVTSVVPDYSCITAPTGSTYRRNPFAVASVTATVDFTFPFAPLFAFGGGGALEPVTATIADEQRIFGI